jgi:hypothetical protein
MEKLIKYFGKESQTLLGSLLQYGFSEKLIKGAEKLGVIETKDSMVYLLKKEDPKNYAIITKDSISEGEYNDRVLELSTEGDVKKRFMLYDDDDILYYTGYFWDDDCCDNQQDLYDWGMYDSGCTKLKVAVGNGKFEFEIC